MVDIFLFSHFLLEKGKEKGKGDWYTLLAMGLQHILVA